MWACLVSSVPCYNRTSMSCRNNHYSSSELTAQNMPFLPLSAVPGFHLEASALHGMAHRYTEAMTGKYPKSVPKNNPQRAKAQPARERRQLTYQAISTGCWPNTPKLAFSKWTEQDTENAIKRELRGNWGPCGGSDFILHMRDYLNREQLLSNLNGEEKSEEFNKK